MEVHLSNCIITECFGDVVGAVAKQVGLWKSATLSQLVDAAPSFGCNRKLVINSLAVLLQHNLLDATSSSSSTVYSLRHSNILAFLRLPRYIRKSLTKIPAFKDKVENMEIILTQIMASGTMSAFQAIRAATKQSSKKTTLEVSAIKAAFYYLVQEKFICRVALSTASENAFNLSDADILDQINVKFIANSLSTMTQASETESNEKDVQWRINTDRLEWNLASQVIISAVSRRIDDSAGALMNILLKIMLSDMDATSDGSFCWPPVTSLPINFTRIKQNIDQQSVPPGLKSFPNEYMKVLVEDPTRFVDKIGDSSGGEYSVGMKHIFTELTSAIIGCVVMEKFGSKALRIFRIIRQNLHIEESHLQSLVMIPPKEAKLLTYQLMENNFIQLEDLRKSSGVSSTKSFFLFYFDICQVARMVRQMCLKAMLNMASFKSNVLSSNVRLLDKEERINSILSQLEAEGGCDAAQLDEISQMLTPPEKESINKVRKGVDKLAKGFEFIDETLFILDIFLI